MHVKAWALLALFVFPSCAKREDPPSGVDALQEGDEVIASDHVPMKPPSPYTVDVREGAAALEAQRKLAAKAQPEANSLDARLNSLSRFDAWDTDLLAALEAQRERSGQRLVQLVVDPATTDDSRRAAIGLYLQLESSNPGSALARLLDGAPPESRTVVYAEAGIALISTSSPLPPAVVDQVTSDMQAKNDALALEALEFCAHLELPLSESLLEAASARSAPNLAKQGLELLVRQHPTKTRVDRIRAELLAAKEVNPATDAIELLRELIDAPEYQAAIVETLHAFIQRHKGDMVDAPFISSDSWTWPLSTAIGILLASGQLDEATSKMLVQDGGKLFAGDGLAGLALNQGTAALPQIEAARTTDLRTAEIAKAYQTLAKHHPDAHTQALAYLEGLSKTELSQSGSFALELGKLLDEPGRKLLERRVDDFDAYYRGPVGWYVAGQSHDKLVGALVEFGIFETPPRPLQGEAAGAEGIDAFYAYLVEDRRAYAFDVETGTFPNRHDRLIVELAKHSGGALALEAASEAYVGPDGSGHYEVSFIANDKVYSFKAEDMGDWYDLGATLHALNRALADGGGPERFSTLPVGGQMAEVFCLDESKWAALAGRFGFEKGSANAAAAEGKAFEAAVLKQMGAG